METRHGPGSGHDPDCFGCRIKTVQVSQSVYATRTPSSTPPAAPQNAWEKGVVTDSRGLPVVNDKGQPLGVAELASDRHRIETRLKEIKDPAYWASRDLVTASTT